MKLYIAQTWYEELGDIELKNLLQTRVELLKLIDKLK